MKRLSWRKAVLALVGAGIAAVLPSCAREQEVAGEGTAAVSATLDPRLVERLAEVPGEQRLRLITVLQPEAPVGALRRDVEVLRGNLVERFEIIHAVVVVIPASAVLDLAAHPHVERLELADTGAPPPAG